MLDRLLHRSVVFTIVVFTITGDSYHSTPLIPSTSKKTPTERRPLALNQTTREWGISVIDSGENQ